jgi:hypothetical protein
MAFGLYFRPEDFTRREVSQRVWTGSARLDFSAGPCSSPLPHCRRPNPER